MTPLAKFNSIIVTATTMIMYMLWLGIEKIDDAYIERYWLLLILVAALTSLGFYRFLTTILEILFKKIKLIKKFILGDRYLEGTWVGVYVGLGGNIRYIFETYEQSLEDVLISGYSYKDNKTVHGKWKAINPIIDCRSKKIIYYYETDMISNSHINQGFASFTMEKTEKGKYYDKMQGFSSDLYCAEKIYAIEEKISEDFWSDRDKILAKAEEVYQKNKDFLPL